jgi:putative intracellular protease/amidase
MTPQPDSPAAELRAAASLLRERAIAAQGEILNAHYVDEFTHQYPGPVGAYAALMHPGVGEPLADWLERQAATWSTSVPVHDTCTPATCTATAALAVARALLGTAR